MSRNREKVREYYDIDLNKNNADSDDKNMKKEKNS